MPFPRRSPIRILAAIAALSAGSAFAATAVAEKSVSVGMAYVPPHYQAGMKFRTPEALDLALAQGIAREAGSSLKPARAIPEKGAQQLGTGELDAWIALLPASGAIDRTLQAVPTGYAAKPMAIMRTDTTIKAVDHLRGRKICVAAGGPYVGTLAVKYGAIETVANAPADSLLAVRTGACDAAVHDSALLEELIKLPEWKKFSASLYLGPAVKQAVMIRRGDTRLANAVKRTLDDWQRSDFINQELKRMARHIAFEVYLDQDVPDCH
jgi:polar amino acid transport system substrate-binding protein